MLANFLQLVQTRMESSRQLVTFGENISLSDSQYPHAHTEWEIKFKYEGDDELVPPGIIHCASNIQNNASFFCNSKNFSISMDKQIFLQDKEQDCTQLVNLLELYHKSAPNDTVYQLHLYYIILHTIYNIVKNSQENQEQSVDLPTNIYSKAKGYILKYYYLPELSVTDIADYVGVSPQYLNKIFHKLGEGSIKYTLLNTRMGHAYNLLSTGEYFVSDVAKLTGWKTQFYFSNVFKKYYGVSPVEIRDKKNKGIFNPMPIITTKK